MKEKVKKGSTPEQEEQSNGSLMFTFIIGLAAVCYMIYVLVK